MQDQDRISLSQTKKDYMPKKRRITYEEKYRVGELMVPPNRLPSIPWLPDNYEPISVEVTSAGRYDDGTEFQNLRMVVREKRIGG